MMRGWKLIPNRAGYAEVALTQLGQQVKIGTQECAIPNEHIRGSRTQAIVQACVLFHEERHTRYVRTARIGCI